MNLKSFVFGLFASFSRPIREEVDIEEEGIEETQGSWSINIVDSKQIKKAEYAEWSKPENIELRKKELEERAPAALELAKKMSKEIREFFNLPSDDPLLPENVPEHMKGQSPSTIRAMLRQEDYEYDRKLRLWKKKYV